MPLELFDYEVQSHALEAGPRELVLSNRQQPDVADKAFE